MKMAEDVKVPEGWRRVKLGDFSEIVKGITYKSSDYSESGEGAIFINLKCILKKGGFNKDGLKYYKGPIKESQILRKGDIIIAIVDLTRDGDIIGYPLRVPDFDNNKVVTMSMDVVKIEPNEQIDKNFLYYRLCLDDVHNYIFSISAGSTVLHLDLNWLPQLEFSVPLSLPEQRKIAEILETVDNAIEKTERIIEKYKRIKQGLMQELLTKGIDENGQIRNEETHRFKDSPLGRIPEEWDVVELNNKKATIIITDGSHYSPRPVKDSKYYIVNIENIINGRIKLNMCKKISKEDYKNLVANGCKPENNDVLFTKDGTIGISLVFKLNNENIVLLSSIAILRPSPKLDSYFLKYCLESNHIKKQLDILTGGSALKRVVLRDIKNFQIPLPPPPEQKRIASILSQVDETIEKEQGYKEKLEEIKRGLMEDLLTGKVRVNKLLKKQV